MKKFLFLLAAVLVAANSCEKHEETERVDEDKLNPQLRVRLS